MSQVSWCRSDRGRAARQGSRPGGARDIVDRASALRVGNRALAAADDLLPAHRQARSADVTFLPQPSPISDWYRLRNIPYDQVLAWVDEAPSPLAPACQSIGLARPRAGRIGADDPALPDAGRRRRNRQPTAWTTGCNSISIRVSASLCVSSLSACPAASSGKANRDVVRLFIDQAPRSENVRCAGGETASVPCCTTVTTAPASPASIDSVGPVVSTLRTPPSGRAIVTR